MKIPKYKFHRVVVRYKTYKAVGIQKLVLDILHPGKYIPYSFLSKDGYREMAYDLRVYKSHHLKGKTRMYLYGAEPFKITKEEVEEATGLSQVCIMIGA